jgi:hypothetical protein
VYSEEEWEGSKRRENELIVDQFKGGWSESQLEFPLSDFHERQ